MLHFEIPDRSVPEDRRAFWTLAGNVAQRLQSGEAVLIHCAGGVGRTATFAICSAARVGRIGEQRAERGVAGGIDRGDSAAE